jgi:hypothetical protein
MESFPFLGVTGVYQADIKDLPKTLGDIDIFF